MATEIEKSLRNLISSIAKLVEDASEMEVITEYIEVDPDGGAPEAFAGAKLAARTVIKFDADTRVVVPVRRGEDNELEIDDSLFDVHERNVEAAIEYRTGVLQAVVSALQSAWE